MRILFLSDFFPPETNAAANRVFERAQYWVEWGHQVTVVCSCPNFPRGVVHSGYRNRWYQTEVIKGIQEQTNTTIEIEINPNSNLTISYFYKSTNVIKQLLRNKKL